ncbi:hypothetical protein Agub_g3801 [Astrephomene gubernaculifera]|uniref:Uncharacterized protein n=1 Tax=Astrephomene gubernaculifera TaxID=47775 RepID=A0AAD3HJD9_9CHLO|nr:hypothetical protein Agub_g3801 [Astrephomene gubernaculifera]
MLVDEVQEVVLKYHGNIGRYFRNGFNVIEVLLMVMLAACGGLKVVIWKLPQDQTYMEDLMMIEDLLYNTASILVWARLLQFLTPLYDNIGVILMLVRQMIWEVLKFALPGLVLMLGVAFAFYSIFRNRYTSGLTFPVAIVKLFQAFQGDSVYDQNMFEPVELYRVYVRQCPVRAVHTGGVGRDG